MTAQVTLVGNTTRDPELRFTPGGMAVASFGLAVNRKYKEVEEVSFFDVVAYGSLAENVSDSVTKGQRVVVTGRIAQRTWETKEGEKRSKIEAIADEVGPSLRWATAQVQKTDNQGKRDNQDKGTRYDKEPQGARRPANASRTTDQYDYDEEPF